MPRNARLVIAGIPHHLVQRGNNRQEVFYTDQDRRVYLELLKLHADREGLDVLGYCLMANHVHLIGTPRATVSLSRAVGRTHLRYTQRINTLLSRSGHLWQSRFYSCALDSAYLWTALIYVERNPVRLGLAETPWEYPWSSAAVHVGEADPYGLVNLEAWKQLFTPESWRERLRQPQDITELDTIRSATQIGRPLGTHLFIDHLERELGMSLHPRPVGRPRKQPATETPG